MFHINLTSVDNLISKANKHVALRLRLDSMALRMLMSATVRTLSFYFRNFANGSERKGLSAFTCTGKFPYSTAGLHLVLNTSCLRKKSRLVRNHMVECFDAITIDAKHLYFKIRFFETLSSFCIFEKALFLDTRDSILETRNSILETRSSNVSSIEARGSSLEVRVSSVNLLLSGTVLYIRLTMKNLIGREHSINSQ